MVAAQPGPPALAHPAAPFGPVPPCFAGKPKGVVHCTGGYMVYTYTTTKYVFNMSPGDIYW